MRWSLSLSLLAFAALAAPLSSEVRLPQGLTLEGRAEASLSRALTLDELVREASQVVVGTPLEQYSVWEELGGSPRVVTYTRLRIERSVVGSPESELWVRTLGGQVNGVGQYVPGEARLRPGRGSLLFLAPLPDGVLGVLGLGQGHFELEASAEPEAPRVVPGPERPARLPSPSLLRSETPPLLGLNLPQALAAITRARARLDAGR